MPGPGKRKRDQAEEEGILSRSLRRTKPNQESTAPKVGEKGHEAFKGDRFGRMGGDEGDFGDGH